MEENKFGQRMVVDLEHEDQCAENHDADAAYNAYILSNDCVDALRATGRRSFIPTLAIAGPSADLNPSLLRL